METLGRHLMIELWDCNPAINQPRAIKAAIVEAVEAIGATLLNLHVHAFSPQGVTGVATLAESHLALHTWPEHRYLAADVFTCGLQSQPQALLAVLQRRFQPGVIEMREIIRGRRPDRENSQQSVGLLQASADSFGNAEQKRRPANGPGVFRAEPSKEQAPKATLSD